MDSSVPSEQTASDCVAREHPAIEPVVMLYVTTPDLDVARRIADALIDARLAACANLLPGMTSVYRWNGAVQHDTEVVVICKTVRSLVSEAETLILTLHPYECPCVVAMPVVDGSAKFLAWVNDETRRVTTGPDD